MEYWKKKIFDLEKRKASIFEFNNLVETMVKDEDLTNAEYTELVISIQQIIKNN